MAHDVLSRGLHREIDAVHDRLEIERRRPGVVDDRLDARRRARLRNGPDVLDLHRVPAPEIEIDGARLRTNQLRDTGADVRVEKGRRHPIRARYHLGESAHRLVGAVGDEEGVSPLLTVDRMAVTQADRPEGCSMGPIRAFQFRRRLPRATGSSACRAVRSTSRERPWHESSFVHPIHPWSLPSPWRRERWAG